MTFYLLYLLAIVIAAFLWANLEIHIEGSQGWAANLPTWKVDKHILLDLFYGGRPATRDDSFAVSFVFFFFFFPFFFFLFLFFFGAICCIVRDNNFFLFVEFLWFV